MPESKSEDKVQFTSCVKWLKGKEADVSKSCPALFLSTGGQKKKVQVIHLAVTYLSGR